MFEAILNHFDCTGAEYLSANQNSTIIYEYKRISQYDLEGQVLLHK